VGAIFTTTIGSIGGAITYFRSPGKRAFPAFVTAVGSSAVGLAAGLTQKSYNDDIKCAFNKFKLSPLSSYGEMKKRYMAEVGKILQKMARL
jgi:hypothetical protein